VLAGFISSQIKLLWNQNR
jgi:hypothetical protein